MCDSNIAKAAPAGMWASALTLRRENPIKHRNPEAKALADKRYHHRIIKSKKLYTRKPRYPKE